MFNKSMKANIIFEDGVYVLLQKSGLFGIRWPVFCTYLVMLKLSQEFYTVNLHDKSYFLAVIQRFTELGGDPRKLRETGFFFDFCDAVVQGRKSFAAKYFFHPRDPLLRAKLLFADLGLGDEK